MPFMLYLLLMSNTPARERQSLFVGGADVKGDGGGGVYLMVSSW